MSHETKSPRRVCLEALRNLAVKVRNGSYFVKRGAIDWANFPFDKHPRAIGIMLDEGTLLRAHFNEGKITLEIMGEIAEQGDPVEIDDAIMDEFVEDAESILSDLRLEVVKGEFGTDDKVVAKLVDVRFVETHDATEMVQGVIVNFTVEF